MNIEETAKFLSVSIRTVHTLKKLRQLAGGIPQALPHEYSEASYSQARNTRKSK